MTLLRTARTYQKNKSQAMVGRTGALAIELVLFKANANSRPLVKLLRGQCVHSIQNDEQYAFMHFVVLTWFVSLLHPTPFVTRTAAIDRWLHDFRDLMIARRCQGPISQRTENIFLWAEIIFLWRVALSELVLRENSIV
jgi:hypothetical protein